MLLRASVTMTTQRRNSFAGRPRLTLDIVGEELERGAGDGHPLSPWHDLAGAKTEKRQSRRSSTGSISSRLFSPRSLGLVHPPTPRTISGLKIPKHSPRDGTPLRGGKGAAWGFGGKESGFGATSPRGNRPRSPGVSRRTRPLTPRSTIAAAVRFPRAQHTMHTHPLIFLSPSHLSRCCCAGTRSKEGAAPLLKIHR